MDTTQALAVAVDAFVSAGTGGNPSVQAEAEAARRLSDVTHAMRHGVSLRDVNLGRVYMETDMQVKKSSKSGNVEFVAPSTDGARAVNHWGTVLGDVPPFRYNIPFTEFDDFDVDNDIHMKPINLKRVRKGKGKVAAPADKDSIPVGERGAQSDSVSADPPTAMTRDEKLRILLRRAEGEGMNGHFLPMWQSLIIVRAMLGWERSSRDRLCRVLSFYLKNFHEGVEPFAPTLGGKLKDISVDTMASKRIYILMMGMYMKAVFPEGTDAIGESAIDDLVLFIFDDPYANMKKWKDMSFPFIATATTKSKKGTFPQWVGSEQKNGDTLIHDYNEVDVSTVKPDLPTYNAFVDDMRAQRRELESHGLHGMASVLSELPTMPLTTSWWHAFQMCGLFETLIGFGRSETVRSHQKQAEAAEEATPDEIPPMTPFLEDIYRNVHNWAIDNRMYPSFTEALRSGSSAVTAKSAGGFKTVIDVEIGKGVRTGAIPVKRDESGSSIRITATDKRSALMRDPWRMWSKSEILRDYTEEDPGSAGERDVVGAKARRRIQVIRVPHFLAETVFFLAQGDHQMQRDTTGRRYGTTNDFDDGKVGGNVMQSHADGFIATTTHKTRIGLAADFSAFDETQRWRNVHKTVLRTTEEVFTRRGLTSPWGISPENGADEWYWEGGLLELYRAIRGQHRIEAWFKTRNGDTGKTALIFTDMRKSGELDTKIGNSYTNQAHVLSLIEVWSTGPFSHVLAVMRVRITGDDSWIAVDLPNEDDWTDELRTYLVDTTVDTARRNGFIINESKTAVTRTSYEYLKIFVTRGVMRARNLIQLFDAERQSTQPDPISIMRSYAATVAAVAMRGGDVKALQILMKMTWCFLRKMRIPLRRRSKADTDRPNGHFYLAYGALYTPKVMGGVGALPFTHIGSSKDALCYYYAAQSERLGDSYMFEVFDAVDAVNQAGGSTLIESLLRSAANGEPVNDVNAVGDPLKPGRDFFRKLKDQRAEAALKAEERLRVQGFKMGMLAYSQVEKRIIEQGLSSARDVVRLDRLSKVERGLRMIEAATAFVPAPERMRTYKGLSWLYHVTFLDAGDLQPWRGKSGPAFPTLNRNYRYITHMYGMSSDRDANAPKPAQLMALLRRNDPGFPRNLDSEVIFRDLTGPKLLNDLDASLDYLTALGARPDNARQFMQTFANQATAFAIRINSQTFSTADDLVQLLDLTLDGHHRVYQGEPSGDKAVDLLLAEIAYLYSVIRADATGQASIITTSRDPQFAEAVQRDLYGRLGNPEFQRLKAASMQEEWNRRGDI